MTNDLEVLLQRSNELDGALITLLDLGSFDDSERAQTASTLCSIAWQHGIAARLLIASDLPTTGIAVLRLQFEAITRAIWLAYAADDDQVSLISAPLQRENELAASKLPSVTKILSGLQGKAPPGAVDMLHSFKEVTWPALNSFVHSGLHPLKRHDEGYPPALVRQILVNVNALVTMTAMMLANLTGDAVISKRVSQIQRSFADCLPELVGV